MQVTKPRKQRKRLFQAPDHIRHRKFSARLSPELRASHKTKTVPVRSGDTIRVMRGDHKGFEGKITSVERKKYRIFVEGLGREKVDGTTIPVSVHPSKVMITNLNLDDKWRRQILDRKEEANDAREKILAKTPLKEDTKEEEKSEKKQGKSGRGERKTKEKLHDDKKTVKRKIRKTKKQKKPKETERSDGGE